MLVLSVAANPTNHIPLSAFEQGNPDASLQHRVNQLLVISPPHAWAYAAILPLDEAAISRGPVAIRVTVGLIQGHMGFGILNTERDEFLVEQGYRSHENPGEICLRVPAMESASALVIRNWQGGGNASRAEIEAVTIEAGEIETAAAEVQANSSEPLSSYWFVRYLESQVPALRDSSANDWQRVCALCDWVYANIPVAESKASVLEARYGYEIYNEPVESIIRKINDSEGGFLCAGLAVLLQKIYELFGYTAYTYNMGSPQGEPSHMVTLVNIEHEDKTITTVQDVMFNSSLAHASVPLDFLELLSLLRQRRAAEVQHVPGLSASKFVVGSHENLQRWIALYEHQSVLGPMLAEGTLARVLQKFSWETYHDRDSYEIWLASQLSERNILYLFLFPLSVGGKTEAPHLMQAALDARQALAPAES